MRPPVHALLHDQTAWHRARVGDRAIGGERSWRQDFRREYERKRNYASYRIAARTKAVATWAELMVSIIDRFDGAPAFPARLRCCMFQWKTDEDARRSIAFLESFPDR